MMRISPKVTPLRFWSQKVLPLVYDNSLSYYEVLDKVVHKLNELIAFVTDSLEPFVIEILNTIFANVSYNESTKTINLYFEEGNENE